MFLGRDAVKLRREVTHLREEWLKFSALSQLARDFEHLAGRESLEREKLVLQLGKRDPSSQTASAAKQMIKRIAHEYSASKDAPSPYFSPAASTV